MKERLDHLVFQSGLAPSGEKAKALIMSGSIYVNGQRDDKPGTMFAPEKAEIVLHGHILPYVSRGGLKLEKALQVFSVLLQDLVCMDIGASTGGFTDCMLQNGAKKVYAVDVGYGQLDWKLRQDSRVVCMEKTNFRYLTPRDIPEKPEFASVDVSFISLSKILPPAMAVLKEGAFMVCLVKPQFEAGRDKVGKKGVVKDPLVHEEVIGRVCEEARGAGFSLRGLDYSPVKGPEGNLEYLLYLQKSSVPESALTVADIQSVVSQAHRGVT